jgi:hypothetical protein
MLAPSQTKARLTESGQCKGIAVRPQDIAKESPDLRAARGPNEIAGDDDECHL